MEKKRIALAGYPSGYFLHFSNYLITNGYEVYWICGLTSDAHFLRKSGVDSTYILDINQGFDEKNLSITEARTQAHSWETHYEPRIYDIILMDRLLSRKPPDFSMKYMAHVGNKIGVFLSKNRIHLVSSWRDTALQLMTMLVCKRQQIPFVVPTRVRIPQEMYMFTTSQHTANIIKIRETSEEDRIWAEKFLRDFRSKNLKPALKRAARSFSDVFRMFPIHLRAFTYELRRSPTDRGNDYARYPILRLVRMYFTRKYNLVAYKCAKPGETDFPDEKFALYALHTQPESSIDVVGSYFSDQIALVKLIARSLPASHSLYVKVHPTDMDGKSLDFYRELKQIPGVRLIDYSVDSRSLLLKCDILFALSGTIAYEAALLGKPAIVFAKNFFNILPSIKYCDAPPRLPALIHGVLYGGNDVSSLDGAIIDFLSNLRASSYDGEVSRFHLGQNVHLTNEDLTTALRAYNDIYTQFINR